ncbi:MAG: hypothetical protein IPK91_13585 [Saprospiraceae bacterium]|nr:hypothetical protein [Saprospiraceae bacterium]MBK8298279.1 hypothetical protein [Saprospiraceae bacterium]
MNSKFFIISLFLTINIDLVRSQFHDTTELKLIINKLKTPEQHKIFWDKLYQIDQTLAQKGGNHDSIFERNLILASMYINKYGFPDPKRSGNNGYIASYIWVHTKYLDMEKFTFPIIMKGFKSGLIEYNDLVNYFISGMYTQEFDIDDNYQNISLNDLFYKLQLNLSDTIDIHKLLLKLNRFHSFEKGHRSNLGIWQIFTPRDTLRYNDIVIPRGGEGEKCQMFKHENENYYFGFLNSAVEYKEIEFLNANKTIFKTKYYHGIEYYEIMENGDITWFRKHNVTINMRKIRK